MPYPGIRPCLRIKFDRLVKRSVPASAAAERTKPGLELGAGLFVRLSHCFRAGLEVRDAVVFFRYFEDLKIVVPAIYSTETRSVQHRLGLRLSLGFLI